MAQKKLGEEKHGRYAVGNSEVMAEVALGPGKRGYRRSADQRFHLYDKPGGLNGSTQHFLEVYSQESENLKPLAGVDLSAAPLCSDPTGNSRTGRFSSVSIVVRARLCFRSSRVVRDSADHRSRLSHPWPP